MGKMKQISKIMLLSSMVLGLAGCGASKRMGSGGDISGVGDVMQFYGTNLTPEQEKQLLEQRIYYFGYDRYDLNDQDTLSIYAHAKYLITKPHTKIRVEGHTDEWGSREYNVALGEKRAKAVANILMMKGVPQNQITVVSYGKEKPEVLGHDESAWKANRRAHLVYEVE
jgi:peptidoglycan-associated lipoprotein